MSECDKLLPNTRKRDICRGYDAQGNPVDVTPSKRADYLRHWRELGLITGSDRDLIDRHPRPDPPSKPRLDWDWESGPCQHAGDVLRSVPCKPCLGRKEVEIKACEIHGECAWSGGIRSEGLSGKPVKCCRHCDDYKPSCAPTKKLVQPRLCRPHEFRKTETVTGFLKTGSGRNADGLQDAYRGAAVFLLCGGPSLAEMPLEQLNQIGVVVAALNNAATLYRPHLWFMVDSPSKFSGPLWRDPGVMKFTKSETSRINGEIRDHSKGGNVVHTGLLAHQCPSVFFVETSSRFTAETFLTKPKPAWECEWRSGKKKHVKRSVMLVAIRLLYWLGFRTVFLLGADFHYRPEKTYAFPGCDKGDVACGTNNTTMGVLNHWFAELRPEFERRGFRVYNCTPESRLTAFDFVEFPAAVQAVAYPKPLQTRGLYRGA